MTKYSINPVEVVLVLVAITPFQHTVVGDDFFECLVTHLGTESEEGLHSIWRALF